MRMDEIHFAPPNKPWEWFGSPVNTLRSPGSSRCFSGGAISDFAIHRVSAREWIPQASELEQRLERQERRLRSGPGSRAV